MVTRVLQGQRSESRGVDGPRLCRSLPVKERLATLDRTVGRHTTQAWRGLLKMDLMRAARPLPGAARVQLVAASGYSKTFTFQEAGKILLATHVGGEPLRHAHGALLRPVVRSRCGWFWVKWLVTIRRSGHRRNHEQCPGHFGTLAPNSPALRGTHYGLGSHL